jgi:hypothetical protein
MFHLHIYYMAFALYSPSYTLSPPSPPPTGTNAPRQDLERENDLLACLPLAKGSLHGCLFPSTYQMGTACVLGGLVPQHQQESHRTGGERYTCSEVLSLWPRKVGWNVHRAGCHSIGRTE